MVVRTCARRHFRHRVGATERQPVGPREAAEELYHCLKHYLLFDWQVPLVPLYARLIPDQVRALGQRLLDLKTPAALAGAAGLPVPDRADVPPAAPANSNTAPAAPPVAAPKSVEARVPALAGMLTTDGKRLNAAAFAPTLLAPEVRAVLPRREFALHPTAVLGSVGAEAAEALVERLSLRQDRLAVLLMSVYDVAGGEAFLRLFGQGAEPYLIDRLVAHARQSGIGADSSLADVAAFVTRAFSRLKAASVRG
ncbi:MAG: hypothetical protein HY985_09420 [Magnetospirillum sp.]|nr:hypothetical protein [Magnetospirillum sp.]